MDTNINNKLTNLPTNNAHKAPTREVNQQDPQVKTNGNKTNADMYVKAAGDPNYDDVVLINLFDDTSNAFESAFDGKIAGEEFFLTADQAIEYVKNVQAGKVKDVAKNTKFAVPIEYNLYYDRNDGRAFPATRENIYKDLYPKANEQTKKDLKEFKSKGTLTENLRKTILARLSDITREAIEGVEKLAALENTTVAVGAGRKEDFNLLMLAKGVEIATDPSNKYPQGNGKESYHQSTNLREPWAFGMGAGATWLGNHMAKEVGGEAHIRKEYKEAQKRFKELLEFDITERYLASKYEAVDIGEHVTSLINKQTGKVELELSAHHALYMQPDGSKKDYGKVAIIQAYDAKGNIIPLKWSNSMTNRNTDKEGEKIAFNHPQHKSLIERLRFWPQQAVKQGAQVNDVLDIISEMVDREIADGRPNKYLFLENLYDLRKNMELSTTDREKLSQILKRLY